MKRSIPVLGMTIALLAAPSWAAPATPASGPAPLVVPRRSIPSRIVLPASAPAVAPVPVPAPADANAAAEPPGPMTMPADEAADANGTPGEIQLSLPPTMTLGLLIEYVSKRMGLNIIFDEEVGRGKISISSPTAIPQSTLIDLLKDALKMSDLELIDTGIPGWKTIGRKAIVKLVPVKHVEAEALATRITSIMVERARISAAVRTPAQMIRTGMATGSRVADVTLVADKRTNQIAVVATAAAMKDALALLESMDVAGGAETRTYRFTNIHPDRVDKLIRDHIAALEPTPPYAGTIDAPASMLIATTTPEVQQQIEKLKKELDVEGDSTRPRLVFYKLLNTTAEEVLATIRQLYGEAAKQDSGSGTFKPPGQQTGISALLGENFSGPNKPPAAMAGGEAPTPPVYRPSKPAAGAGATSQPGEGGTVKTKAPEAVVTADKNTNTIIVVATPDVQAIYKQLIDALDKRRPQVLVEVTLVSLNTTNNLSYGVELQYADTTGTKMLLFNSFGLSTVDPTAGITALAPGTGFNGILLKPDHATAVVQALANDSGSRVMSAPRVLVNDNATGTLASVSEEPFTSVNASDTVSTTAFAGYASAGTTVTVTPHISEDDYLQLKYGVTVNSFIGATAATASTGIPPARQTDTVTSEVTVPNGYAVVVGGLTRTSKSLTENKIPFLGDIPIVGLAFGSRQHATSQSTLFVFIRPIILRDDKFQDLKNLSREDLLRAEIPTTYPTSEPLIMR